MITPFSRLERIIRKTAGRFGLLSPEGLKQHRKICVSFDHLMKKMLEGVEEEKVPIFTELLDHLIASRDEIK